MIFVPNRVKKKKENIMKHWVSSPITGQVNNTATSNTTDTDSAADNP